MAHAAQCRDCHPRQAAAHAGSAHTRALFKTQEHPLYPRFSAKFQLERGPFSLAVEGGRLRAGSRDSRFAAPMEWAFGSGEQAITFVSRVSPEWYVEFYPSWYRALGGFAPTPGQHALRPDSLERAVGLLYKTNDPATGIRGCFECHSTGPVTADATGALVPTRPGVHCEACHGDGAVHRAKPTRHNITRFTAASGRQLNDACGQCHRKPSPEQRTDWNYPWNVRHQPLYLNQSRCFQQSRGKLGCLTCHDAHSKLSRDTARYNATCQGCHAKTRAHGTNCVDCHMPAVTPEPPLRFSNHWIGIYPAGAKLRPRR